MNWRGVLFLLGRLLIALAVALLVPAAVSYYQGQRSLFAFLVTAGIAGVTGFALQRGFAPIGALRLERQDAFVLVAAAWLTASVVGALPYVLYHGPGFMVDGLFESASGFTTTGASVFADVQSEPPGLLLWRSLTHWLGGMGIIVLGIAILPKLAVGGMELLGAEAPGPTTQKLTPRIAQTAKALWGIYALVTGLEVGALVAAGMGPFDAVNHAFATMATGGFSTNNASIAGYASPTIEWIITLFMIVAGANFALHFQVLRGKPGALFRDAEFRAYLLLLAVPTLLLTADLVFRRFEGSPLDALRLAAFQTTSIVTTTGFATADYDQWSSFARCLLFLLMFVGGCAGSTGGSVKVARVVIVAKKLAVDLKRLIRPHAVLPVRLGRMAVPEDVVNSVTTFFMLFLALFATGGLLLAMMGLDPISAFSASAACLGNIGPGFGAVGPVQNYAGLPDPAKLVLTVLMIVGRLELYTVLVLLFITRRPG